MIKGTLMKKKIVVYEEIMYIIATFLLAFGVAMTAAADFGVSMVVAPAYILSLKIEALSFGAGEYVIQGILFILMCIILRGVKLKYFFAFLSCLIYGLVLDLIRLIVPFLNPEIFAPGSFDLWVRILLLAGGMIIISFSLSIAFRVYLYPQVNDYFVKVVSKKFNKKFSTFKLFYDASFLILSVGMTLILFGNFNGIGIGTIVMTVFNGWLIKLFSFITNALFEYRPIFKKAKAYFENDLIISKENKVDEKEIENTRS